MRWCSSRLSARWVVRARPAQMGPLLADDVLYRRSASLEDAAVMRSYPERAAFYLVNGASLTPDGESRSYAIILHHARTWLILARR